MSEQIRLSSDRAIIEGQTEEPGRSTQSETGIQSSLVRISQSTQTTSCQTRSIGSNTKPLLGEDDGDGGRSTSSESNSEEDVAKHARAAPVAKKKLDSLSGEKSAPKRRRNCASRRRLFGCDFCPYTSNKSGRVRRHLMTHTGEKPFKCSECSAEFRSLGNCRAHARIHTGEKPFKCSFCPFQCAFKYSLNNHMRRHTSGTYNKCDLCSFVGITSRSLARHMQKHEPVACPLCEHVCAGADDLVAHLASGHPRSTRGISSCVSTLASLKTETTEAGDMSSADESN